MGERAYVKMLDVSLPLDIYLEHEDGAGVCVRLERMPAKSQAVATPQCCNCAAWEPSAAGYHGRCAHSEVARAVSHGPNGQVTTRGDFGCIHFTLKKGGG